MLPRHDDKLQSLCHRATPLNLNTGMCIAASTALSSTLPPRLVILWILLSIIFHNNENAPCRPGRRAVSILHGAQVDCTLLPDLAATTMRPRLECDTLSSPLCRSSSSSTRPRSMHTVPFASSNVQAVEVQYEAHHELQGHAGAAATPAAALVMKMK